MSLQTQPYKGARDFYPQDKRIQKYMFDIIRQVVERFGYEEYDAPILEPLDLYRAKTGDEIVNEQVYSFTDRGGREVAIRPEMTPTVSRMVAAQRQELPYPLRWYSIPNLWRYERPQRGRLREHWQLNVDIFGVEGLAAEYEMIELVDALLRAYGATRKMFQINLNSRKLTDSIMADYLGLPQEQAHQLIKLVDRKNKMDQKAFAEQAGEILDTVQAAKFFELMAIRELKDLPKELAAHPSVQELKQLFAMLKDAGITNASFDITLMRGFDYYTDVVFEVSDTDPENNRSMFGGGRYDGLVGLFGVAPVPTVGFGMGDVTLQNFLETNRLLPDLASETQLYVALVGDTLQAAQPVLQQLREAGLNVAVDVTGRKLDKQTRSADKKNIRYVLYIGEQELAEQKFKVKDLRTGKEDLGSVSDIVKHLSK